MRKFEVAVSGRNFLLKIGDELKKTRFYAARFVEAKDTSEALEKVMNIIKAELKPIVQNPESDLPSVKVEDVCEVYFFQDTMELGDMILEGKGFYWEDE